MQNVNRYAMLIAGAAALMACEDKTAVSERNFADAISADLKKEDRVCIKIDWPVYAKKDGTAVDNNQKTVDQAKALVDVGLAFAEEAEVKQKNLWMRNDRKETGIRYDLSDAAKPYLVEKDVKSHFDGTTSTFKNLCFGTLALNDVVKWEGPMPMTTGHMLVTVTVKMVDLAPWAADNRIESAFPDVIKMRDIDKSEFQVVLKPTNLGWEADARSVRLRH